AGLAAQLEHRDLALAAIAESEGNDRGADAGAHVDRAGRFVILTLVHVPARSVEPVHVTVAGDGPDGELVQPRERDLTGVRVPRQHQRDAVPPQTVRLLGDVREGDAGDVVAEALHGL